MNDFFAYKFSEGAFRMFNIMFTRSSLVNELARADAREQGRLSAG